MLAGDTIYLLEGRYHQSVELSDITGTKSAPKVIMAYPGHKVVMDGTIQVDSEWTKHDDNFFKNI